jgi:hypothetical protein
MPDLEQYKLLELYDGKSTVKMIIEGKGVPLEYAGFKDFRAYIADYFNTNFDLLPKDDDEDIDFMEHYMRNIRSGIWDETKHCWADKVE